MIIKTRCPYKQGKPPKDDKKSTNPADNTKN